MVNLSYIYSEVTVEVQIIKAHMPVRLERKAQTNEEISRFPWAMGILSSKDTNMLHELQDAARDILSNSGEGTTRASQATNKSLKSSRSPEFNQCIITDGDLYNADNAEKTVRMKMMILTNAV